MRAADEYLRTKVLTATPEQLQLMLYDGAIRFAEQAKTALRDRQYEQSYTLLTKAQRIITEMSSALNRDAEPELCARLAGLYGFVFRKLLEANIEHRVEAVDEALSVLRYQRDTWVMLLERLGRQNAAAAAAKLDIPAPDARMEASICMQG